MVQPQSQELQNLVYNIRLSTVGPGRVTGADVVHEPGGLDLALKLHYLKAVYFFDKKAAEGLTTPRIKEGMFLWSSRFYFTCGRFRRSESGHHHIKCNDCGVRFVEAQTDKTVEEWLDMADRAADEMLVFHRPIGPEIAFSPLIYLQVTRFKCGGMSIGLSWAHVLGDPFSLVDSFNIWGQVMSGLDLHLPPPASARAGESGSRDRPAVCPLSVKRVVPVGDLWVTPNNAKMETFCFAVSPSQLSLIQAKATPEGGREDQIPAFESLCALIWQCMARAREDLEPKAVTLCKRDPWGPIGMDPSNSKMMVSSVRAGFHVRNAELKEIAEVLVKQATDERTQIAELMEYNNGTSDAILYGAKLTFVDMGEADLYGLKLKGLSPKFTFCNVEGVGDEGAVFVLPEGPIGEGKFVAVTLPAGRVVGLKSEMRKNGLLHG